MEKNYISVAVNAAKTLAESVLKKIKDAMGIHSPSDKTFEMGKYADQGMANGISKFAGVVIKSVQDLGRDTISGFGNVASRISDVLNSDMEFNPKITPVLDLAAIEAGSTQMNNLLGKKTLNVGAIAAKAAVVSSTTAPTSTDQINPGGTTGQTIQFTQINNSPKELSRIDIYRQTKNQLLQLKGVGGVS